MCEQIRFSTFSLLIKNGDRPPLVLKPRRQAIIQSSRTVITTAASVAQKLCSSPANLPNIQGKVSFRLTSLQHLHAPLLFIRGPITQVFFIFFLLLFALFALLHVYSLSFLLKQKMYRSFVLSPVPHRRVSPCCRWGLYVDRVSRPL
jgi:hypothetical protein